MDSYIKEDKGGLRVQAPICDRQSVVDLASEFSLPDYRPEIKRLLRVRTTVLPPDHYVGAGSADFSGLVTYDILYAGNDNALYCINEKSEYQFSVPLETAGEFDWNDGIVCEVETPADAAVGRVLAPRKISVKCRLRPRVRLWGTRILNETLTGNDGGHTQRLYGQSESAQIFAGVSEVLHLGDELLIEAGEGSVRVVSAEAQAFVNEATAGSGAVSCRGEVALKLLLEREGSEPTVSCMTRRIPFTCEVPVDGAEVNCEATACGACSDLQVTVEDTRILCEVGVLLQARAQRNLPLLYTRDLYSTAARCETKYSTCSLLRGLQCHNGNVSVNTTLALEECGIRKGAMLVDLSMSTFGTVLECEGNKYVLNGHCRCQAVLQEEGELFSHEFEIPFRYVCEGSADEVKDSKICVDVIACRGRLDSERIGVDAELSVSLATCGETQIRLLREAAYGEPLSVCGAVYTVCYPTGEDTLWSVAKRYHRSVESISANNSLSDAPAADSPASLAGIKYLLV